MICVNLLGKAGSLRSPSHVNTVLAKSGSSGETSMPEETNSSVSVFGAAFHPFTNNSSAGLKRGIKAE